MLQEQRLGAPAYEAINLSMVYSWGKGWTMRATGRRDGCEGWDSDTYELMTSPELADVAASHLFSMLGL
jgi:hypothetical protein